MRFSTKMVLLATTFAAALTSIFLLASGDIVRFGQATMSYDSLTKTQINLVRQEIFKFNMSLEQAKHFIETGEGPSETEHYITTDPIIDPWGHKLRACSNAVGRVDLYSMGADEKSLSGGNDPDDISSWGGAGPWYLPSRQTEFFTRLSSYTIGFVFLAVSTLLVIIEGRKMPRN